jgi:hypothetical protein
VTANEVLMSWRGRYRVNWGLAPVVQVSLGVEGRGQFGGHTGPLGLVMTQ